MQTREWFESARVHFMSEQPNAMHFASSSIKKVMTAAAFYVGLGLCWAAEETLSFCVSPTVSFAGNDLSVLYVLYLICMVLCSVLVAIVPAFESFTSSSAAVGAVLCCGPLGLVFIAASTSTWAVSAGVALFVIGCLALNLLWFKALAKASSVHAQRAIVGSAGVTFVASLAWGVMDQSTVIALVGASFVGSFACHTLTNSSTAALWSAHEHSRLRRLGSNRRVVVGIAIVAVGFACMQYKSYGLGDSQLDGGEALAHLLSLTLLAVLVFCLGDSEHTISAKIAATLMLFSFFFQLAYPNESGIALLLAAGCEGMLELVVLLALAELASYSSARPGLLCGSMLALFCGAQLVGCGLVAVDVWALGAFQVLPVASCIAAALIFAAVWLLNDKAVTSFLWPSENEPKKEVPNGKATDAVAVDGSESFCEEPQPVQSLSFEQKATLVIERVGLTPREGEVMIRFARGRSSSFIAEQFFVSSNTIRTHITRIYAKCEVHSRQELITLIETADEAAYDEKLL